MDFSNADVVIGGVHGYAEHINLSGIHQQHIALRDDDGNLMKVWGACFDNSGNAYFALGQIASYEDYTPHDICYIPKTSNPRKLATLIGRTNDTIELWIYDEDGNLLDSTRTGLNKDVDWEHTRPLKLCIACDGDTVYYTDQGATIFKYSLTTGQLAPFDVRTDQYIYAGIDIQRDGDLYVAVTPIVNAGVGPRRDVSLGSAQHIWTDQVNETPIAVYKRLVEDGSEVLNHVVSLSPSNDNTEVLSLAANYYPCGGFFGFVTLVGAT